MDFLNYISIFFPTNVLYLNNSIFITQCENKHVPGTHTNRNCPHSVLCGKCFHSTFWVAVILNIAHLIIILSWKIVLNFIHLNISLSFVLCLNHFSACIDLVKLWKTYSSINIMRNSQDFCGKKISEWRACSLMK